MALHLGGRCRPIGTSGYLNAAADMLRTGDMILAKRIQQPQAQEYLAYRSLRLKNAQQLSPGTMPPSGGGGKAVAGLDKSLRETRDSC